jgi:predicted acetyltransferase
VVTRQADAEHAWVQSRVEELASGWAWMRQRAELSEAGHPGWSVRPTRRHDGLGLEAVRQSDGTALIGTADEVEAEIARLEGAADDAP